MCRGKSTVVAMLTGLFAPDTGDASVEGLNIKTDMHLLRQQLGVCPQHDILFSDLTVEEHLTMFASFKGTPRGEIKAEVEKMIQSVGLTEKRQAYAGTLSGGQKRKLSVAIAFIGNSKVVILDGNF
jgi:ATP-binding cassette subfamily A (ABC1) protein 3